MAKGRHFKSRFIQPGLAGYPEQFGTVLIGKEALDNFVYSLEGKPVIIRHKDNIKSEDIVGTVKNVWYDEADGWYWCDGVITDTHAMDLINSHKWSVSCSYDVLKLDDEGGTENNIPYDMEFLDGVFTHLALVDNPRYEKALVVLNSKAIAENSKEKILINGIKEILNNKVLNSAEDVYLAEQLRKLING